MEQKPTILAACIGGSRHKAALAGAISGALAISAFLQGCGYDGDFESKLSVDPSPSGQNSCACHAVCHCDVDTDEKQNYRQTTSTYVDGVCTCNLVCTCDLVCTCNSVCTCDTEHHSSGGGGGGGGGGTYCSCNTICTCNLVYR